MACPETNLTGDATLLPPLLILCPLLVEIQPHVHQGVLLSRNVSQVDAHLAVVDFSVTATPLPCYAHRILALLSEARGIENEYAIGLTQLRADLPRQLLNQQAVVPEPLPNELLQRLSILVVKIGDGLRALPLHVREQPCHILPQVLLLCGTLHDRRIGFDEPFQAIQHPVRYSRIQGGILQKLLHAEFKTPFHRLLLSLIQDSWKGLLPKCLQFLKAKIQ